jgi:4,5-DOPA dioxygenase extradiol
MFAVQPGRLGPQLQQVGRTLRDVTTCILIISAHWQTPTVCVMRSSQPATIHDFGGFPEELYRIQYPASGAPAVAERARELLEAAGFNVDIDARRGLDHGAWVPLLYLSPDGLLPVFQVSLPLALSPQEAVALGAALAPLRAQGVLILGSGSLTHNLRDYRGADDSEAHYARSFARWVEKAAAHHDLAQLMEYRSRAPAATRAHPTDEHYLPLLVAAGAAQPTDTLTVLDGGMDGVLSMDCLLWSAPGWTLHSS